MAIWAVLVDPATGEPYRAVGGSGGGGGGDASAANQTTEIARLTSIRDATGGSADTAYASSDGSSAGTVAALLKGLFVRNFGIGLQADAAYTDTTGAAAGGLVGLLKGAYVRATTLAGTVIAAGSAAPATGQTVSGVSGDGNSRRLFTGTNGGLLPGQATPTTPAPVAVSANTATFIDAATRATRLGFEIQNVTATTAVAYIKFEADGATTATASATNFDRIFPVSSATGTQVTPLFATTGPVSIFTTAAATFVITSWLPR